MPDNPQGVHERRANAQELRSQTESVFFKESPMKPAVKLTWKTERRKVSELVPYEFNPRKISPEQAARLTGGKL